MPVSLMIVLQLILQGRDLMEFCDGMGSGDKYPAIEDKESSKLVVLPPFIERVHSIVVRP
jgi:hypothetical protein